MKTARKLTLVCVAVAMIGLSMAPAAMATDTIKILATVTQQKTGDANDDPPPPPPPPPKQLVSPGWDGIFTSGLTGYSSSLRLGLDSQMLPYIEQDNLFAAVVDAAVDRDGNLTLTAYDPAADVVITLSAVPAVRSRTGEVTMMQGVYQISRMDSRGVMRTIDRGTMGIIAILIG